MRHAGTPRQADDGTEASPEVKAFFARNVRAGRPSATWRLGMTARPAPARHWRSYGTDPLPTGRGRVTAVQRILKVSV
jgi:hypothetical protein